jgi:hypothetical protein
MLLAMNILLLCIIYLSVYGGAACPVSNTLGKDDTSLPSALCIGCPIFRFMKGGNFIQLLRNLKVLEKLYRGK